MLASSLLAALFLPQGESATDVYAETQRRLDALPSLVVRTHPSDAYDTDHRDVTYGYLRPKMAFMGGWKTDGKRTARKDSEDEYNRSADSDDLATASLLGFESFAIPLVKPVPTGAVRPFLLNGTPILALDLDAPGRRKTVLFVDPRTYLPIGNGRHIENGDRFETGYFIDTKAKLMPKSFEVNWIRSAPQVYGELRKWLARKEYICFNVGFSSGVVMALKPDCYLRYSSMSIVVQNGAGVTRQRRGEKPVVKKSAAWPPEFVPGLEAFFGKGPVPKVSGMTKLVDVSGYEAHAIRAVYSGRGEYRLYVDATSSIYLGYDRIEKGKVTSSRRFDYLPPGNIVVTREKFVLPAQPWDALE